MSSSAATGKRVALAAVAGAHGIRGEVRLKLFAESIESLARHSQLLVGGVGRRLLDIKDGGRTAVARFEGIGDRTAAEALRGQLIEISRDDMPALDEGEYYHVDLIGLPCVNSKGEPLGVVSAVENFGAGDLLEIEDPAGRRSLIPFRAGIAENEGERIVIDPAFLA